MLKAFFSLNSDAKLLLIGRFEHEEDLDQGLLTTAKEDKKAATEDQNKDDAFMMQLLI